MARKKPPLPPQYDWNKHVLQDHQLEYIMSRRLIAYVTVLPAPMGFDGVFYDTALLKRRHGSVTALYRIRIIPKILPRR